MESVRCAGLLSRSVGLGDDNFNNINNVNADNQFNNNGRARGIAHSLNRGLGTFLFMKTFNRLFEKLVSFDNLMSAYLKARRHKSNNPAVRKFDKHWQLQLVRLHRELKNRTYTPRPLKMFVLRDPKTRKICVSDFRDRVVHHALVNILQPIFEPRFIHDSYASRKGKGTQQALKRFDTFLRKVTKNGQRVPGSRNANTVQGYVFKADIKHYFDTVDHDVLVNVIARRVKDKGVLWLVKGILENYYASEPGKGMPLGNWTSQFFANIYLNELDQFVKHNLKVEYYIRYVDDFVIIHRRRILLHEYEQKIKEFLKALKIGLHPTKCSIVPLSRGVNLLGFRVFYHYTILRNRNVRKIYLRLSERLELYDAKRINAKNVLDTIHGWNAYAMHANTFKLRQRLAAGVVKSLQQRTMISMS